MGFYGDLASGNDDNIGNWRGPPCLNGKTTTVSLTILHRVRWGKMGKVDADAQMLGFFTTTFPEYLHFFIHVGED